MRRVWGTYVFIFVLFAGCSSDDPDAPNSVQGQWNWVVSSFDCPVFDGVLIDPQDFSLTQNGDTVTASFTDSNGNQCTISGRYEGGYVFATITIRTPAGRDVVAELVLRGSTEGANDTLDGSIRIVADTEGICDAADASVWMTRTSPTSPEEVFTQCGPVDIVFVMDTSGSMDDEADALCDQIDAVLQQLNTLGLTDVRVFKWGINEDADAPEHVQDDNFTCLEDNVRDVFNDPIVPGTTDRRLNLGESDEDWGPAVSITSFFGSEGRSQGFQWRPNAIKIMIPISDEGPDQGDSPEDPEDAASIQEAIQRANAAGVIASPIIGTGAEPGTSQHALDLAAGTGGVAFRSVDPELDFGQLIFDIVFEACGGTLPTPIPPPNLGDTMLIAATRDGRIFRVDPADASISQLCTIQVGQLGVSEVPRISSMIYNEETETLWAGIGGDQSFGASIFTIEGNCLATQIADNSDEAFAHPGLAQRRSDRAIFGMPGDGDEDLLFINPLSGVAVEFAEDIDDYADTGDMDAIGNGMTFVGEDLYLITERTLWQIDDFTGAPTFIADCTLDDGSGPIRSIDLFERPRVVSMTTRPSDKKVFAILRLDQDLELAQTGGRRFFLVEVNVLSGLLTVRGQLEIDLDGLAWVPNDYFTPQ